MVLKSRGVQAPMLPIHRTLLQHRRIVAHHAVAVKGSTTRRVPDRTIIVANGVTHWHKIECDFFFTLFFRVSRPRAAVIRFRHSHFTIYPCGLCLPCARSRPHWQWWTRCVRSHFEWQLMRCRWWLRPDWIVRSSSVVGTASSSHTQLFLRSI